MTTLELTDLIQQQLAENPVLEEVATQEEVGELAEKILDHPTSADPGAVPIGPSLKPRNLSLASPSSNGSGDLEGLSSTFQKVKLKLMEREKLRRFATSRLECRILLVTRL